MQEYGGQFTIIGPDGTTVQLNDGASGILLEDVTGLDSPNVRTNIEDLPEYDGAVAGDFYLGQRPISLKGRIAGLSASQRNAVMLNMQRAMRGLRADVTVKWQPTGQPAVQLTGRLVALRFSGAFVKDWILSLLCADPRIYSQALNTQGATGTPATPGAAFDWVFNVNFGGGSGATLAVTATNAGNFNAPPVVRVWGPIQNPQVKNNTTGESLYLDNLTLASGDWVDIDMLARTVKKQDGSSFYDRVRFPGSVWWQLMPGSNTIQLWGSGSGGGTELDVTWRDSWA